MITQKELKNVLDYDRYTGLFTWTKNCNKKGVSGTVAGSIHESSAGRRYVEIKIGGSVYQAHRLAWLYVYGKWPENLLTHLNGDGLYNAIQNLKEIDHKEASKNKCISKNNTSGFTGVTWCKRTDKWVAQIQVNGKGITLGYYYDKNDAIKKRKQANEKYGFKSRHGQRRIKPHF